MLIAHPRMASWITWGLAGLAILIWLPRLLGTEPTDPGNAKRPKAVLVDVTELPDMAGEVAEPTSTRDELKAVEPVEEPELRLLGPLEAELPSVPGLESNIAADEPPETTAQDDLAPKLRPAPSPTIDDERQLAAPSTAAPLTPVPNGVIVPLPTASPAVKYWVVSTRCCRQTHHRCGIACRFVCHAVTDGCQTHPVEIETLLNSLIPGVPLCIFTHGSFTSWQDVWQDAEYTFQWLRSPCPQAPLNFIYFTWPSEGIFALATNNALTTPVPNLDFAILGRRADVNGFYLADLIGALPPSSRVCLVGHSLGTRAITSALHLLGGGTVQKQTRWNPAHCGARIRVVLAAAAIDHDWLNPGERFGCALQRAECLLSLRNECDLALSLYPLRRPFSSRALARAGFTRKDQRRLGEHVCQVSELDVTPLLGTQHSWPYYVRCLKIAAAIAPSVYFESAGQVFDSTEMPR